MTTDDEEYHSLLQTRRFLADLLNPKITPRVRIGIRERAKQLLRHYPYPMRIEDLYGKEVVDDIPAPCKAEDYDQQD